MAINIFEGARRIAQLVALLWAVGISVFTAIQNEPYITGTYYVSESNRKLGHSHPFCEDLTHFRQETITVTTKIEAEAYVTLCFPPEMKEFVVTIPSGVKFAVTAPVVATEQEVKAYVESTAGLHAQVKLPKEWRGDTIVRNWEAQAFAVHLKNSLVLSQADEEWIHGQWWLKRWEQIRQGLLVIAGGWVCLYGLTWSIGWIVRGFLGIPRGQDHKMV